jgi:hypothetical protein
MFSIAGRKSERLCRVQFGAEMSNVARDGDDKIVIQSGGRKQHDGRTISFSKFHHSSNICQRRKNPSERKAHALCEFRPRAIMENKLILGPIKSFLLVPQFFSLSTSALIRTKNETVGEKV